MPAAARALAWRRRADFRAAPGVLLVLRAPPAPPPPAPGQPPAVPADPAEGPEILLALADDGQAVLLAGHVDLGTGLRTAYGQIAADELDLPMDRVHVLLGDTARGPNQGATIASSSIQIHAPPLRLAAAQARAWLLARAAALWGLPVDRLESQDGEVLAPDGRRAGYGELVAGHHTELWLDPLTPVKPPAQQRLVGRSVPRVDLADKVSGRNGQSDQNGQNGQSDRDALQAAALYVHDLRLPGMLHGRVLRPPYAGLDAGDFVGRSLRRVDEASIAHLPGIVAVVVEGDFVGLVAEREEVAEAAVAALQVEWAPFTPVAPLDDLAQALRAQPASARVVAEHGAVDEALAGAAQRLDRQYVWPYQLHASIGPSCAVAQWHGAVSEEASQGVAATVWAGTQNPHALRRDLARLSDLPDAAVAVVRLEAAGCYGRNSADDVAADALLLARAPAVVARGAAVRVQLSRAQEHAWEPKGAAQLMQVQGGLDAQGAPLAYDFATRYPSNGAPTLALLLTGRVPAVAQAFEMGDRTAVPPYAYAHQRITVHDMAPILRASWLRGVSALPNSFAHECYIDELAHAAGADPLDYRLRHLPDARAAELLRATAAKAGWRVAKPDGGAAGKRCDGDWQLGQGIAYARYVHSRFPGFGAAWAAWVAQVAVHRRTGELQVRRVVVGQDAGLLINPQGAQQQVHGNVLQTTSRALKERLLLDPDTRTPAALEWGAYPLLNFRELPVVEVLLVPRPDEPPLGVGESSSVPGTAAIANAIFDATGLRLRQPPFTPEVLRAAMAEAGQALDAAPAAGDVAPVSPAVAPTPMPTDARNPQRPARRWWAWGSALALGVLGTAAGLLGAARPAIAPVARLDAAATYRPELIARGAQLAGLGNCIACHTAQADGAAPGAGGRAIATPFGTLYSSNLTPDVATGIGTWSFSAFQRAMREGVARDGRHLYPAFPYTAFTQASDEDLQALYAYLMARPAVAASVPVAALDFPYNQRPLLAAWKSWNLQPGPRPAVAGQSALWNRGAYLVNGLGHCGACHTPRDALGAERDASQYLGGALVHGWEAPALGALSRSPVPWTEAALQQYLRTGAHPAHGVAGGPMAEAVRGLATLPEDDLRAIAHYLVALQGPRPVVEAAALQARAAAQAPLPDATQRLFEGACGACHHEGDGPRLLGLNQPLALNANLHSARPDNLLRTLMDGIPEPAFPAIGHMPGFRHAFNDRQMAELAAWLRRRYAPDQPPWAELPTAVARARAWPAP